jgi:hypothetical protein
VSVYRLVAQGTIDELRYLRQIYKLQLKQEIFRSAEGSDEAAPPRSFLGVSDDKNRKGELFGMENLMKFSKDSSFMEKVWKSNKKGTKSSLVAGNSEEIGNAWVGGGEPALEEETFAELQNEFKKLVAKVEDNSETFAHHDFLQQGRVRTAYTQDRSLIICGETQNALEFVPGEGEDTEVDESDHVNDETEDGCHDSGIGSGDDAADDRSPRAAAGAPNGYNDVWVPQNDMNVEPAYAMNKRQAEEDDGSVDDGIPPSWSPRQAQNPQVKGNIFTLCGLPVTQIRGRQTTFSKEDIFLPTGAK